MYVSALPAVKPIPCATEAHPTLGQSAVFCYWLEVNCYTF